ncbi:hypothetical protein [Roseobacter sp. HKCCA0434]|uniref:hypothetical protein n=1 Tax=Roseobacter sp. HKCCA0434 TaxID=3079297 RepID=UPI0029059984|nr:hypothetical protein [Roseobacter sp. HKCCA0434]
MRRLALALTVLALPGFAQDGPRVIDLDGGGTTMFPQDMEEQLSEDSAQSGEPEIIAVRPQLEPDEVQSLDALVAPVTDVLSAGATRIQMLDRCAALESSLIAVMSGSGMNPQAARPHRARFAEITQDAVAERQSAGMEKQAAEDATAAAILPLARAYLDQWEGSRSRTGSYFSSPLRRSDQLACIAYLDGRTVADRPTLAEQIGGDDGLGIGTDQ